MLCAFSFFSAGAQSTSEKFAVSGNCGMCKKTIEKAAITAGASLASWDASTKELSVTYNTKKTAAGKIRSAVAGSGYDTPGFQAPNAAYDRLHECCKYERVATAPAPAPPACCTEAAGKECCQAGICTMPGHTPAKGRAKASTSKATPAACSIPSSL